MPSLKPIATPSSLHFLSRPQSYMTTQLQPIGHHLEDRTRTLLVHWGHLSASLMTSSFLPGQSSRKHLVLPRVTRCLQPYSTTDRVHILVARRGTDLSANPCRYYGKRLATNKL